MATYITGDIHGCFTTLMKLLRVCGFQSGKDRLISVGDLVNVGPDSLRVLQWAVENGMETVLGNHDLHLLAVAVGARPMKKADTFGEVLAASGRDELLEWLRRRPLFLVEKGFAVAHAGLLPHWTLAKGRQLAGEVESELNGGCWESFLGSMYGDLPDRWDDRLRGEDRWRVIVNAFTRLRMLTEEGRIDQTFKGPPEKAPGHLHPWYEYSRVNSGTGVFFFGHWAAHGARRVGSFFALDSGCAWGRELSAVRIEGGEFFSVESEMNGRGSKA